MSFFCFQGTLKIWGFWAPGGPGAPGVLGPMAFQGELVGSHRAPLENPGEPTGTQGLIGIHWPHWNEDNGRVSYV